MGFGKMKLFAAGWKKTGEVEETVEARRDFPKDQGFP